MKDFFKNALGWARSALATALVWTTGTDEGTWVGHALQGAAFTTVFGLFGGEFYGLVYTVGAFSHREIDQAQLYLREGKFTHDRLVDGIGDFVAPYAASMIVVAVFQLFF